jgi:hypothetical protein
MEMELNFFAMRKAERKRRVENHMRKGSSRYSWPDHQPPTMMMIGGLISLSLAMKV